MPVDAAAKDRELRTTQTTGNRRRDHGHLQRITVNLVARASEALQRVSQRTGDSRTDTINRAIQIYDYLDDVISRGGDVYVRESKDSDLQLVKIL
jgi:hypothetical protein